MGTTEAGFEAALLRKLTWRLVPFLMGGYFLAFVDRVNSGFAALRMNHDIGLSPAAFGLGAGVFYLSYVLFEVPSNLAMQRFGARVWLARIMVSWGLVSALMAFVVGPWSFGAVRFLLGAAEAGFFPGVILYLTQWFPRAYRGRIISVFMVAIPVSSLLGSPLSAALLGVDGWLGLRGWQWMFVLEALPAVLMGVAALRVLPDGPAQAGWLEPRERDWLQARLAAEGATAGAGAVGAGLDAGAGANRGRRGEGSGGPGEGQGRGPGVRAGAHGGDGTGWASVGRSLRDPAVLILSLAYAGPSGLSQALSIWAPQMIRSFGLGVMQTGLLNAVPFAVASVAMVAWGASSDRRGERMWHTVLPLALAAVALGCAGLAGSVGAFVAVLSLTLVGTYAFKGPFWALAAEWVPAPALAAGLAQVNAAGNLAGFAGNALIGAIVGATGSYPLAVLPLVGLSVVGCGALVALGRRGRAARLDAAMIGAG